MPPDSLTLINRGSVAAYYTPFVCLGGGRLSRRCFLGQCLLCLLFGKKQKLFLALKADKISQAVSGFLGIRNTKQDYMKKSHQREHNASCAR